MSHCGSLYKLDQRVVVSPSTAFSGGKSDVSVDDELTGLFNDNNSKPLPLEIVAVVELLPVAPSLSVTVSVTVYVPEEE